MTWCERCVYPPPTGRTVAPLKASWPFEPEKEENRSSFLPLRAGWREHKWKGPIWKQSLPALCVTQTCDSPAVSLIWVSGLFHPGEHLFAHRSLVVLLFGPPRERALKRLRLLVCGCVMGAAKPADITQRLAEEVVLLDVARCAGFLHFHEMCTGAPFWPSDAALAAKCHMAGFQRALGFWPERIQGKKRLRENQGGDHMIHLINSIVRWHE